MFTEATSGMTTGQVGLSSAVLVLLVTGTGAVVLVMIELVAPVVSDTGDVALRDKVVSVGEEVSGVVINGIVVIREEVV